MVQMTSIPKKEQENMLASFWSMLRECESKVDNAQGSEAVLRHWVEQWYGQWNRITGDNKEPIWKTREKQLGLSDPSDAADSTPSV